MILLEHVPQQFVNLVHMTRAEFVPEGLNDPWNAESERREAELRIAFTEASRIAPITIRGREATQLYMAMSHIRLGATV
jgi:hypothetical protein